MEEYTEQQSALNSPIRYCNQTKSKSVSAYSAIIKICLNSCAEPGVDVKIGTKSATISVHARTTVEIYSELERVSKLLPHLGWAIQFEWQTCPKFVRRDIRLISLCEQIFGGSVKSADELSSADKSQLMEKLKSHYEFYSSKPYIDIFSDDEPRTKVLNYIRSVLGMPHLSKEITIELAVLLRTYLQNKENMTC